MLVSRLLRVLRKIVGFCGFHLFAQVEVENVVFQIYRNKLVSSTPPHLFLTMGSQSLTNFAANRNHVTVVMSQKRNLCSTAKHFVHLNKSSVQRSKQSVFIVTLKLPRSTIRNTYPLAVRLNLPSPDLSGPKFNENVFTEAPVSRFILAHSNRLRLLMAPRSKLRRESELAELSYV